MKPYDPRVWSGEAAERFRYMHNSIWYGTPVPKRILRGELRIMGTPLSREAASAILEQGITDEHVTTKEIPHGKPRTALLHLLEQGKCVDFYRTALSGELVIDIEGERPWHERRWSAPAWVAFVAGEHLAADEPGRECQCGACNERRQAEAKDRYDELQRALQAARAAAERSKAGEGEPSA
jgi:hypothetical protein